MKYLLILFRAGRTAGDSRTGECEVEQVRPQNLHHQPAGGPGGGGCSVQAESSIAGIHHRGQFMHCQIANGHSSFVFHDFKHILIIDMIGIILCVLVICNKSSRHI